MRMLTTVIGLGPAWLMALFAYPATAQAGKPMDPDKARIVAHWTGERRANAIPRDLAIDARGLGYLRMRDGALEPYGHRIAALAGQGGPTPSPFAKPVGNDTAPPSISAMNPAAGATIGTRYTFSAKVSDKTGVASVTIKITQGTTTITYSAAQTPGTTTWTAAVTGLVAGASSWQVVAKDSSSRGNTSTSATVGFTVSTSPGTVSNAHWTTNDTVKKAAGRIYFEMPGNAQRSTWVGYVCSGTVATDGTTGRSVIITAAHCVYDDANKAFARNVMFIPNQDATTGGGTDLNCGNDPIGCWVPSWGVVDVNWTTRTFPNNIAWDYAYYVVADTGAHLGTAASSDALDAAAGSLAPNFLASPAHDIAGSGDYTHALGYSYDMDPNFMYCAQDMTTNGSVNWWLGSCGLTGGSSGGPWVQPMDTATGSGPVVSVNSWGYTNQPGMAGPKLSGTSASCVFATAKAVALPGTQPVDGNAGTPVTCP